MTGATRGIGRAVASELARRGAQLTIVSRTANAVAETASELGGHGVIADLTDLTQLDRVIDEAVAANGRVDILINNAGLNAPTPLARTDAASLQAQLTANLVAPLHLTRAVLPSMLDRGTGCIVNVSSIAGDLAIQNQVPYCATKSGLSAATRALQRELRSTEVHALLVVLGLVATDMIKELSADPVAAAMARRFALLPELHVDVVARELVNGIETRRNSLVLPRLAAPMHHLRLLPTRIVDGLLAGVRV